jgi:hypothetical protein
LLCAISVLTRSQEDRADDSRLRRNIYSRPSIDHLDEEMWVATRLVLMNYEHPEERPQVANNYD